MNIDNCIYFFTLCFNSRNPTRTKNSDEKYANKKTDLQQAPIGKRYQIRC